MGLIETKVDLTKATKVEFPFTPQAIAVSLLPATEADYRDGVAEMKRLKAEGRPFQF